METHDVKKGGGWGGKSKEKALATATRKLTRLRKGGVCDSSKEGDEKEKEHPPLQVPRFSVGVAAEVTKAI